MTLTIDGRDSAGAEIDFGRRAPRIKAEDVFLAADALLIDGHRPTIDRVRMKLGRGSPNTINEHLDGWWTHLGARLRDAPGQALPGLPEAVTASLLQLWNVALREAHQALQTALTERETAVAVRAADLDQREAELKDREVALTTRFEAHTEALTLARGQLEEANQRARTLEATLQQHRLETDALRVRTTALDAESATLRRQLQEVQNHHAAERSRLEARYDAQQVRSAQEVDRLRQSLKEEQKGAKELRARFERVTTERDAARMAADRAAASLALYTQALARVEAQQSKRAPAASASAARRKQPLRKRVRAGARKPENPQ